MMQFVCASSRAHCCGNTLALCVLLAFFCCNAPALPAQTAEGTTAESDIAGVDISLAFMMGFPIGDFADVTKKTALGGGLSVSYQPWQLPIAFGIDIAYLVHDSKTERRPWSLTIPDVTVEVERSNNIVPGHFFLRLQPPEGNFRPWLEGLIGFNYLFTETSVRSERDADVEQDIASSTNVDDGAFSYGVGAGIRWQLFTTDNLDEPSEKDARVYLEFGVRYLIGGEAEYLTKDDIEIDNQGNVRYNLRRSETDMIGAHIGISVLL